MAAKRASVSDSASAPATGARLKVTQTKSTISHIARNRATVKALGLHGIGSTSIVADNAATRGMVRQVRFLVSVEEMADPASTPPRDHEEKA
jgi:large subunit ribosomal protein L30